MPGHSSDRSAPAFEQAQRRLFEACNVHVAIRRVRLADPPLAVRVLEAGEGAPVVLVHGSGMSASTWAPLMPHLRANRLIALDLPGFGLSDAFDYSDRSLREHAVAQLTSLLDELGLERVPMIGTSLGGMWRSSPVGRSASWDHACSHTAAASSSSSSPRTGSVASGTGGEGRRSRAGLIAVGRFVVMCCLDA